MKKSLPGAISPELRDFVKDTIAAAFHAGKKAGKQEKSAYQRTEVRLYALPALVKKIEVDMEELDRLRDIGITTSLTDLPQRSRDIIRINKGGLRLAPEEVRDGMIEELMLEIAADEREVEVVRWALTQVQNDYYFSAVEGRYFHNRSDEEMATALACDERTIRRQRSRIVSRIAVYLYGSLAIN